MDSNYRTESDDLIQIDALESQFTSCLKKTDWAKPLGCSGEIKRYFQHPVITLIQLLTPDYYEGLWGPNFDNKQTGIDVYEETCVCDTPLCNVPVAPLDFYCHLGDFEIDKILKYPDVMNRTVSCYTNRNQCVIIKSEGN